jgi:hypothetical protein
MTARTVLEELTEDGLTREHVVRRVEDWSFRLGALYADIDRWLPAGWTARHGAPFTMHEELMRNSGVPPRELPTLELLHDRTVRLRIRPYGLWIIGANGRLDLTKGRELFLIVDHAKTFDPPNWQIAPTTVPREFKPFDEARLKDLLAS